MCCFGGAAFYAFQPIIGHIYNQSLISGVFWLVFRLSKIMLYLLDYCHGQPLIIARVDEDFVSQCRRYCAFTVFQYSVQLMRGTFIVCYHLLAAQFN